MSRSHWKAQLNTLKTTGGGHIEGVDRDANQKLFANALVALVPTPSRRQNAALYRTTVCDAQGKFVLNGIAPGEYKLFAWEAVPTDAWMNAAFMSGYESAGKDVTVGPDGVIAATLTVIPERR